MKKALVITAIFVILIPLLIAGFLIYYLESPIRSSVLNDDLSDEIEFSIDAGETSMDISKKLKSQGITPNDYSYYYYVRTRGIGGNVKTGVYKIVPSELSMSDLASLLETGTEDRDQITVTIPEGYTSRQIEEVLLEEDFPNIKSGELSQLVNYKGEEGLNRTPELQEKYKELENKHEFLAEQPSNNFEGLEGYLFPDTYIFLKESSIDQIVDKMLENFGNKYTEELSQEIEKQGKNLHEIIIMASIVQREAGRSYEEDQDIAGVFYNRLDVNMTFGSCATLQYITNTNKFQFSYADTQIDSPYNTYINAGLPPGPIANPGLEAIKATINATDHDYYYFLNTKDGDIIFSKNEAEHNSAKRKYLD